MPQTDIANVAPKRKSNPATSSTSKPVSAAAQAKMGDTAEQVNGMFQMGSLVCIMRGQVADAAAISEHGPKISQEIAALAATNPQIAKLIGQITAVGPYSGLLVAVLPLALQLAANHDKIDADKITAFDVKSPDQLRQKFEAEQATAAAKFQLEIAEAQKEANDTMAALSEQAA